MLPLDSRTCSSAEEVAISESNFDFSLCYSLIGTKTSPSSTDVDLIRFGLQNLGYLPRVISLRASLNILPTDDGLRILLHLLNEGLPRIRQ